MKMTYLSLYKGEEPRTDEDDDEILVIIYIYLMLEAEPLRHNLVC